MEQQIFNEIKNIIMYYLDEPCEINMDTHILRDISINSFDYTSILADIEDVFEIKIEEFNTYCIKDFVKMVMLLKQEK